MKEFDAICGIATPIGEGGISIIRISGENVLNIVDKIFKSKNKGTIKNMKSYTMKYGYIHELDSDEIVDEVIISYMKGPKSFTAEDVVEINCHGGIVSTNKVLEQVIKAGARMAEPGEYTKRAFLNGRIDLSQAEAVMDIIRAKTDLSMKSAMLQHNGALSREINNIRKYMLNTLALVEYSIDFTEDEEEEDPNIIIKVKEEINKAMVDMQKLIGEADEGRIIRDGLNMVIVGKPNVGKSSLLNMLLKENRAIVTDVPGTTRDIIEEYINLDGIPIRIIDTAGIRESQDIVEKIGIQKSKEKINEADLIILVLDASRELDDEDKDIIEAVKDKNTIVLLNKSDLKNNIDFSNINYFKNVINSSTLTGEGIEVFTNKIKDIFFNGKVSSESLIISNGRHKQALYRALENCIEAKKKLDANEYLDLISIFVTASMKALGEITGSELEEDLINKIFNKFCVGK